MILIPQIYIRDGKVMVAQAARTSPLIHDDPVATARAMKEAGAEAIYCIDLGIPHIGASPHLPIIKRIRQELKLTTHIGGLFRSQQAIEAYIEAGADTVALGTLAYQQPAFLEQACKSFPEKIAVHIDVKGGRVTIPGYAVVTTKTAFDYAEQFLESGVSYIFYSDVGADGTITDKNLDNLVKFCRKVKARIICTSEVANLADIERISRRCAPHLEGLILAKALYEDRIDLGGAIAMVSDLLLAAANETTLTET
jgi:phosphoribosylformimino-5-aminoimidazole carboxamide ribotide isomerase